MQLFYLGIYIITVHSQRHCVYVSSKQETDNYCGSYQTVNKGLLHLQSRQGSCDVMMTSSVSSTSLCRRGHVTAVDLHAPADSVIVSYAPSSSLSAFLQSSTTLQSSEPPVYRRHSYQSDYRPPRVTSASGLHGDAVTPHHLQQQQRSPSFAIHELLGLHGPMMQACHGNMLDCSGGYYRQQSQFFPTTYHASAPAPPSTPLSMPDIDAPPVQPPPPPLLPGPPSCHRASTSSWLASTSPTDHVTPELTTAHAHRPPTTYRDAYDVLQRNFKPDVTRAFAAARSVSHKYISHYRT